MQFANYVELGKIRRDFFLGENMIMDIGLLFEILEEQYWLFPRQIKVKPITDVLMIDVVRMERALEGNQISPALLPINK